MNPYPEQGPLEEENDDLPVGEVLSRRRALSLFGLAGGTLLGGSVLAASKRPPGGPPAWTQAGQNSAPKTVKSLPGCVVRPAEIEGPYFVEEKLMRRDMRPDSKTGKARPGVPLTLNFEVSRVTLASCEPRAGVMIDLWQCDAAGVYSDSVDTGFSTKGQDFLRATQLTDAAGKASFTTIYPGWYHGRAVHIHLKVRTMQNGKASGEFTSQLYFPEAVTDAVHKQARYSTKGQRDTRNAADQFYKNGGSQMVLALKGDETRGFTATFDIGLNIG
ncbi:intradiol ring-cleavage dioxygenase [Deinococcus radiomollis]|uniref:intradiol ring-cleavage dioxygenase n=1 Tax=Deinococcus radiomollis TaxID=468916 RepID=UPI0038924F1F